MNKLTVIIVFLCHFEAAVCGLRPSLERPNIILILIDDVGYGDFSSYGHPTQEFNEIDQLAKEGLRFTQWYATAPICTPSRAAILTGKCILNNTYVQCCFIFYIL